MVATEMIDDEMDALARWHLEQSNESTIVQSFDARRGAAYQCWQAVI